MTDRDRRREAFFELASTPECLSIVEDFLRKIEQSFNLRLSADAAASQKGGCGNKFTRPSLRRLK